MGAAQEYAKSDHYDGELIVSLATAHPAKFPEAVIEAGAPKPKLPHFLEDLFDREEKFEILDNDINQVKEFISNNI